MSTQAELPRYQSHKQVWAVKIAGVEIGEHGQAVIAPADEGYGTVLAGDGWGERFKGSEDDLGYYVLYQGGYESWSPTKAFEDGYTRVNTEGLKERRDRLMREAESAAHTYAASVETGDERVAAFEIFDNIRLAGAVY